MRGETCGANKKAISLHYFIIFCLYFCCRINLISEENDLRGDRTQKEAKVVSCHYLPTRLFLSQPVSVIFRRAFPYHPKARVATKVKRALGNAITFHRCVESWGRERTEESSRERFIWENPPIWASSSLLPLPSAGWRSPFFSKSQGVFEQRKH